MINGFIVAIGVILALVFMLVFGFALAKWYRRSTKETAFVRTGRGGQKVIKDGGAFVLPILHQMMWVNMRTLPLTVTRRHEDSLITKDKFRVDTGATFYVKVSPDTEGIAVAAQTLGERTMDPERLASVVEDKLVDALRSVAAQMNMFELHEERVQFVQRVQEAAGEDLAKNGLSLESVSLTALDQTDPKFLKTDNAFDAEGLRALAAITEQRREERNKIEADTRVNIETKNLEADKKSLELSRDKEYATLDQEREVQTRSAQQESEIARERAERKREADLATIEAERATEEARIAREKAVEAANIAKARDLELARQEQSITVSEKSQDESKAKAAADEARSEAVKAAQLVVTAEQTAAAEREKAIALIEAAREAEEDATKVRIKAEADYAAAENQAKAQERLADARAHELEVEAKGREALNAADNVLNSEQINLKIRLALIEQMPAILAELSKPLEKVDSVRVVQMNGVPGVHGGGQGMEAQGNLAQQVTGAMLGYKMQSPIVEQLARELGMDLSSMEGIVEAVNNKDTDNGTGDGTVDSDPTVSEGELAEDK